MGKIAKSGIVKLEYSLTILTPTWINVAGVRSFDPGVATSEDVDLTDYDSTGNQREYGNGFSAAADGSFTINFDEANASHIALQGLVGGAAIALRHKYDTKWLVMPTLIKSISYPVSIGEAIISTVTIKASAAPSWVAVV
jgi:hypothetical protein